jgi:hypothetical protein
MVRATRAMATVRTRAMVMAARAMATEMKRAKVARAMAMVTKRAMATTLTMAKTTKTQEQRWQEE